jgi:gliding motility-associated-like protein
MLNSFKTYIIILLFSICLNSMAQTDTEFWFVAPNITSGHAWNGPSGHTRPGSAPIYLTVTSMKFPSTVTIEQPANAYHAVTNPNGFQPITVNLPANTSQTITLVNNAETGFNDLTADDSLMLKNLENLPIATVNNKGLHITATNKITAYYEVAEYFNTDIYALKGNNALGTEFYASFQTSKNLGNYSPTPYSAIDIVATEDDTKVRVIPTNPVIGHVGEDTIFLTLDRGQTYSIVPVDKRDVDDNLRGTKIYTEDGKRIAITLTEDSKEEQGCRDMLGDQTIPMETMNNKGVMTPIVGTEYIVMKGNLGDWGTAYDQIYILATRNTTNVQITDVTNTITTNMVLNPRETGKYIINATNNGEEITLIQADQPVYVYHITGGGNGCEEGAAVLPSVDRCTGSTKVGFGRSTSHNHFIFNVMARTAAKDSFYLNGNPAFRGELTDIPGTDWAAVKKEMAGEIPVGSSNLLMNTKDVFHLGIMSGDASTGGCYGYFSDYNEIEAEGIIVETGQSGIKACYGDTLNLVAYGGTTFEWKPSTYLDNPYIDTPKCVPEKSMKYTVITTGACDQTDSAEINILVGDEILIDFEIDTNKGCAPLTINITNHTIGAGGHFPHIWYIDGSPYSLNETPPPKTFTNNTDSAITHTITLYASDPQDICFKSMQKEITVYPYIAADFETDDSIGCQPLEINLFNKSSGNTADSLYFWDFGDGGISARPDSVFHSYSNIGTQDSVYTVQLIATSPYMCQDTAIKDITVHPLIDVGFTVDTSIACAPYRALFHNTSTGVDNYNMDFGDGTDTSFSAKGKIRHTYVKNDSVPDTLTVQMAGSSNEGCHDTATSNIILYPKVVASYMPDITNGCDSVLTQFSNLSTGYNLSYLWDFGDGNTSIQKNPEHLFVNLTTGLVVDTVQLVTRSVYPYHVCTDTTRDTINIYPYIKGYFTVDTTIGCPPFEATIQNKSTGVDDYSWSFGDGSNSSVSDSILKHTYINTSFANDTTYNLSLIVNNIYGCTDSLSRQIKVYPDINADFYPDKTASCDPATFTFIDNAAGAHYYTWELGDSASSNKTDTVKHTYEKNLSSNPKDYNIHLFVKASNNRCTDTKDTVITVNPYNKAEFSVENYIDCSPFNNGFENNSFGTTNTYEWYINNNLARTVNDKSSFNYEFDNYSDDIVQYAIHLKATNEEGCEDAYYDTIAVYPYVDAQFSLSPDSAGCHPFDVNINNNSVHAATYYWNLGDGASSSDKAPSHQYINYSNTIDSVYTIKLNITSQYNCTDSISKKVTVYPNPNAAFAMDEEDGCPPIMISMTNQSTAAEASYEWDFGDGEKETTSTKTNVTHTFQNTTGANKNYQVLLKAVTSYGCTDTMVKTIIIYPEVTADFTTDINGGCNPLYITFNNTSINGDYVEWNFDDGETSTSEKPRHYFTNTSGTNKTFNIRLLAESQHGCSDIITKPITVYATPNAEFSPSPLNQVFKNPSEVIITNLTNHYDQWQYSWHFGDNTTSSSAEETFIKTYTSWGDEDNDYKRIITMVASNANQPQCADTTFHTIIISPPKPIVVIKDIDSTGCTPITLSFDIKHKAFEDSIIWDFGDGTIVRNNSSPTHTFDKPGVYNVKLLVKGEGGESYDYKTVEAYRNPVVNFSVYPETPVLPDATIQCDNRTQYGDYFLWYFGDNTTSIHSNPIHTYKELGNYSIKLIATTVNGCIDSLTMEDLVKVVGQKHLIFPNAFKPDQTGPSGGHYTEADESSNIFRPYWKGVVNYNLKIFNRWGELLFESHDVYVGWDGYYKGELCKQDAYIWKVEASFTTGEKEKKAGVVTLLR